MTGPADGGSVAGAATEGARPSGSLSAGGAMAGAVIEGSGSGGRAVDEARAGDDPIDIRADGGLIDGARPARDPIGEAGAVHDTIEEVALPPLRVATRRSALALAQSQAIGGRLAALTGRRLELVEVTTQGDLDRGPLARIGGAGVFVAAVREAVADGRADVAVHSLKDLPTAPDPRLELAAVPAREDPRDALVARAGARLADLPSGARVGTGSPRRAAQLAAIRPDLDVVELRGNVDSRLGRVLGGRADAEPDLDAVVLATAGLTRLGRADQITEHLDPEQFVPAPGQGALAVEARSGATGSDPTAFDPAASGPAASDPAASDPVASDPAAFNPAAFDPAAFDPVAFDPVASDPAASDPAAFDPAASDSAQPPLTAGQTAAVPDPGRARAPQAADLTAGLATALRSIDDPATRAAVTAERSVLATLQAGCSAPVGALATVGEREGRATLHVRAVLARPDGTLARMSAFGPIERAEELGRTLAGDLLGAPSSGLLGAPAGGASNGLLGAPPSGLPTGRHSDQNGAQSGDQTDLQSPITGASSGPATRKGSPR